MTDYEATLHEMAKVVTEAIGTAKIAIVLGSGLGNYGETLSNMRSIAYADIPGFPVSTAPGHNGRMLSGEKNGKRIIVLQGRFHAYEGYTMEQLTCYVRVLHLMGVQQLILTNAAGCVNMAWVPGDLMLLSDFINFSGKNPLIGPNADSFGPRFPDMSEPYSKRLRGIAKAQAEKLQMPLHEGVYTWFNGPCFETPAEIRMARIIGSDAVGMSTVPETIVARHCGMEVLGISCLTNMAAGILDTPLSGDDVNACAAKVVGRFAALVDAIVGEL